MGWGSLSEIVWDDGFRLGRVVRLAAPVDELGGIVIRQERAFGVLVLESRHRLFFHDSL